MAFEPGCRKQLGALKGFGAPETPTVYANVRFAFAVYTTFFRCSHRWAAGWTKRAVLIFYFLDNNWENKYSLTLLVGVSCLRVNIMRTLTYPPPPRLSCVSEASETQRSHGWAPSFLDEGLQGKWYVQDHRAH